MKLRTQFALGAAILALFLLVVAGLGIEASVRVRSLRAEQEVATSIERKANDLSYLSNNYILYRGETQLAQWDSTFASLAADVDRLGIDRAEEAALAGRIETSSQRLQVVFGDIASAAEDPAEQGDSPTVAFLQVAWSRMEVQNRQLIFDASQLERLLEDRVDRATLSITLVVFGLMGAFGVVLFAGSFFMYRRTISGISALQAGTTKVGSGNLDHVIPDKRRDELGQLSRAFNKMTSDLKGMTASKTDLEREIAERERAESERERLLAQSQELVEELASTNEELRNQTAELGAREAALQSRNEELSRLGQEREKDQRLNRALAEIASSAVTELDEDVLLRHALSAIGDVLEADYGVYSEPRAGEWGLRFIDGELTPTQEPGLAEAWAAELTRTRLPLWVAPDDSSPRPDMRLLVPLFVGAQLAGIMFFGLTATQDSIERLLSVAERLSYLLSLALQNARLYQSQRDIASTLQESLLDIPMQIGGVQFGHLYRSATQDASVGGDFYDVFKFKDGRIALLIGDVSGHGVAAARIATLVKDVIHAFAHQFRFPGMVLRKTNELLIEKQTPGFVTAFLGILEPTVGLLTYASAGHPHAMVRDRKGEVALLEAASFPLGVFDDQLWGESQAQLEREDLLFLYTDGAIEARRDDRFFGQDGLREALGRWSTPSPEDLPAALLGEIMAFANGVLADDVAMLAVRLQAVDDRGGAESTDRTREKPPA